LISLLKVAEEWRDEDSQNIVLSIKEAHIKVKNEKYGLLLLNF